MAWAISRQIGKAKRRLKELTQWMRDRFEFAITTTEPFDHFELFNKIYQTDRRIIRWHEINSLNNFRAK